jgi:hypothetical protein
MIDNILLCEEDNKKKTRFKYMIFTIKIIDITYFASLFFAINYNKLLVKIKIEYNIVNQLKNEHSLKR